MSWNPALAPHIPDAATAASIETVIVPRSRDLGGFEVRRALPAPQRQMVGPFIFFDQAGPAEFITGQGVDIRPHPHIGLGTVTYLYRGEFQHRDSLGSNQMILPGAVNWMVAGRGVSHSERTSEATRKGEGVTLRLILGSAYGERAPARLHSEAFYGDVTLMAGARFALPDDHEDRGLYVTSGSVSIAGQSFDAGRMMVFRPGDRITVQAGPQGARLMILGGETMGGPRYIWWNFVASSKDRIEAAKADWARGEWGNGLFDLPPDDRDEFIPAPER